MTLRVWEFAALALTTTGCSFFMDTVPSDPSQRTLEEASECTRSAWLPALDTLNAGVGAINIGIAASTDEGVTYYGGGISKETGMVIGVSELVVSVA